VRKRYWPCRREGDLRSSWPPLPLAIWRHNTGGLEAMPIFGGGASWRVPVRTAIITRFTVSQIDALVGSEMGETNMPSMPFCLPNRWRGVPATGTFLPAGTPAKRPNLFGDTSMRPSGRKAIRKAIQSWRPSSYCKGRVASGCCSPALTLGPDRCTEDRIRVNASFKRFHRHFSLLFKPFRR